LLKFFSKKINDINDLIRNILFKNSDPIFLRKMESSIETIMQFDKYARNPDSLIKTQFSLYKMAQDMIDMYQ